MITTCEPRPVKSEQCAGMSIKKSASRMGRECDRETHRCIDNDREMEMEMESKSSNAGCMSTKKRSALLGRVVLTDAITK